jgi:hypothetical protein
MSSRSVMKFIATELMPESDDRDSEGFETVFSHALDGRRALNGVFHAPQLANSEQNCSVIALSL